MVTPKDNPDPKQDEGWCFPDTEAGILQALEKGATTLWANTILFSSHPLQSSPTLKKHAQDVRIVGQPPQLVEQYDDKNYVNALLRSKNKFTMPHSWTVEASSNLDLDTFPYPIVGKPIRGRGSYGVKVCRSADELRAHLDALFADSPVMLLEEFLAGEEGTVTIMPPSSSSSFSSSSSSTSASFSGSKKTGYWAMPIVVRFNHADGIAPYNGVVAVTSNSRVLSQEEMDANPHYAEIARECEEIAALLRVTAPIRIDVRCFKDGSKFAAFDVNMKPVRVLNPQSSILKPNPQTLHPISFSPSSTPPLHISPTKKTARPILKTNQPS